jgi:predicted esterase
MRVSPGGDGRRRPLILALHGYGGESADGLWIFRGGWSRPGLVLVAPTAESQGWNPFLGSDLNSLDRALRRAFARCRIDPRRIAVGGHSDGAGNALTFGLSNGDLFSAVIGIAPAGVVVQKAVGKPRVLVAHGTRDPVIPARRGAAVVRRLRSSGYDVTHRPFVGGHDVPLGVSRAAVRWFLG